MGENHGDNQNFINDVAGLNNLLFGVDEISTHEIRQINDDPPVLAPRNWRSQALNLIHRLSHEVIDVTLVSPILKD
ncbi:MAG TPA: hypothetical protein PLT55_05120, partial [Acidimicrobiia bacterium]|nr:hypothetical protein [Acidimicrobiia bacterium]